MNRSSLGFGEHIGAVLFDWILGSENEKRVRKGVRRPVDRDIPLLHRLQEGGLNLRRGPVDFVGQQQISEHRSFVDDELARRLMIDRSPHHVSGKEIWRELNPSEGGV